MLRMSDSYDVHPPLYHVFFMSSVPPYYLLVLQLSDSADSLKMVKWNIITGSVYHVQQFKSQLGLVWHLKNVKNTLCIAYLCLSLVFLHSWNGYFRFWWITLNDARYRWEHCVLLNVIGMISDFQRAAHEI